MGCPALAALGLVVKEDAEAAEEILTKFTAHKGPRRAKKGQQKKETPPSGRRAQSGERSPTVQPPPPPPPPKTPTPPTTPSLQSTNRYSHFRDLHDLSSDEDDDASFQEEYGNALEALVADRDSSSKTNSTTNVYSLSCIDPLPTRNPSKLTRKWRRRLHRRRERHSARRASSFSLNEVTSMLQSTVHATKDDTIFTIVSDDDDACADSGATDVMLPDKKAFRSYHTCQNKFVTLGDNNKCRIEGEGTAIFSLNGKTILVRNALHVPALRSPLYSLRKHNQMPGCGIVSYSGLGSFILFPGFCLQVDDTQDFLLSYKSIGRGRYKTLDYAQPRVPSARPSTLIEPEDDGDADTKTTTSMSDDDSNVHLQSPHTSSPNTITEDELIQSTTTPLSQKLLSKMHSDPTDLPPIQPANTAAPCENRTSFETLKLHKVFGCRKFKTYRHLIAASDNAQLLHTGELPPTLGDFSTIATPPHGKTIKKHRRYLDKVHMDIVYGDCMGLGGFRYALLLVDVATRYCWIFGMHTLTSSELIDAFEAFQESASGTPKTFHCDFDKKLIGGKALKWIRLQKSRIIAAPAGRQSSNGLVERTWRTIVQMARAYVTEKQVVREY